MEVALQKIYQTNFKGLCKKGFDNVNVRKHFKSIVNSKEKERFFNKTWGISSVKKQAHIQHFFYLGCKTTNFCTEQHVMAPNKFSVFVNFL